MERYKLTFIIGLTLLICSIALAAISLYPYTIEKTVFSKTISLRYESPLILNVTNMLKELGIYKVDYAGIYLEISNVNGSFFIFFLNERDFRLYTYGVRKELFRYRFFINEDFKISILKTHYDVAYIVFESFSRFSKFNASLSILTFKRPFKILILPSLALFIIGLVFSAISMPYILAGMIKRKIEKSTKYRH